MGLCPIPHYKNKKELMQFYLYQLFLYPIDRMQ